MISVWVQLGINLNEPIFVERELKSEETVAAFVRLAFESAPHVLAHFLTDAARPRNGLVELRSRLIAELSKPSFDAAWIERALTSDPSHLVTFLRYASDYRRGLRDVRATLVAALSDSAYSKQLLDIALATELTHLVYFLRYAALAENGLSAAHDNLVSTLRREEHREWWSRQVIESNLENLVAFLNYAGEPGAPLAAFRQIVFEILSEPEKYEAVLDHILESRLGTVSRFLRYAAAAEHGLAPVYERLVADLDSEKHLAALAVVASTAPLDDLVSFLDAAPFAAKIASRIDAEVWERARSTERRPTAEFVINAARKFRELGRPELVEPCARALLVAGAEGKLRMNEVQLFQVGAIVGHADRVDAALLVDFLDNAATPAWLDRQYSASFARPIALAVLTLLLRLPSELHFKLNVDALRSRLGRELRMMSDAGFGWSGDAGPLALLGVAALAGAEPSADRWSWPDGSECPTVSLILGKRAGPAKFGLLATQVWMGLRGMSRMRGIPVRVSAAEGEAALDGWRAFEARTPFVDALNRSMISWLECSRLAGWTLVRSDTPLRTEVVGFALAHDATRKGVTMTEPDTS